MACLSLVEKPVSFSVFFNFTKVRVTWTKGRRQIVVPNVCYLSAIQNLSTHNLTAANFCHIFAKISKHSCFKTAKSCADASVLNFVARYGAPLTITSDRGRQFTSPIWKELAKFLGCELIHTTSYNPKANGLVERFYRVLKRKYTTIINAHFAMKVRRKKNGNDKCDLNT